MLHSQGIDFPQYREAIRQDLAKKLTPPLSFNRLRTSARPDEATYLVANRDTTGLGFQIVGTEIYVLYRVGL